MAPAPDSESTHPVNSSPDTSSSGTSSPGADSAPVHEKVRSRNQPFSERTATRIWAEQPSEQNPYIAQTALCYGYDLQALLGKRSFVDVFYLLFRGELPSAEQAQLLEKLMIALINPGPRHPATRAAMNAGVGKTDPLHILPIGAGVYGGEYQGAGAIEAAMRFLRKARGDDPASYLEQLAAADYLDESPLPGFGRIYGGRDLLTQSLAQLLLAEPGAGECMGWGAALAAQLASVNAGWLRTGLAAAVLADLGFQPRVGACLFQLLGAPGLVAHGLELANKPITAMPFVKDENYVIERD